ncbi:MAG: nucleotidyltransferase family protein [Candidatus Wukongarchaeota archaeon]|nr:nucleotidyltransferase domain-containing protein [Candidatus Wukongarchaeota archaeon]
MNFAEKALEEVKRYIESLRSRFSLRLVILFGSFAQDSWTEYSDIDVLVVAD